MAAAVRSATVRANDLEFGLLEAPSSRMAVIENAGHFLHLEKPGEVNEHILAWLSG